jgi:hypothetical protein
VYEGGHHAVYCGDGKHFKMGRRKLDDSFPDSVDDKDFVKNGCFAWWRNENPFYDCDCEKWVD